MEGGQGDKDRLKPGGNNVRTSSHGGASSISSGSSRPPFLHSVSAPSVPQIQLSTDSGTHPFESPPSSIQRRPSNASSDSATASASDESDDSESTADEVDEKPHSLHSSRRSQQHMAANKIPPRTGDEDRPGSADTLVEAALDHADAQDRHVRFQDHVLESAALVERMLNRRGTTTSTVNDDNQSARNRRFASMSNNVLDEEELEGGDTMSTGGGGGLLGLIPGKGDETLEKFSTKSPPPESGAGGSVLSRLMVLEAQRRRSEEAKDHKKKRRREKKVKVPMSYLFSCALWT